MEWLKQLFNAGEEAKTHIDSAEEDCDNEVKILQRNKASEKNILDLPIDILLLLFYYLPPKDLIR